MTKYGSTRARLSIGLAAVAIVASAARVVGGLRGAPSARPSAARRARAPYTIGFANRRAASATAGARRRICSAKAQAVASGKVSDGHRHPPRHGRGRPAGRHPRPHRRRTWTRSSSTRTIRTRSIPAIKEATDKGIVVIAIDASVTEPARLQPVQRPGAVRLPRRQVAVRAARRQGRRRRTCAASPAIRPTPTATPDSRRPWPSIRASPSPRKSRRSGTRRRRPPRSTTSSSSGVDFDGIWTSGIDTHDRRGAQDRRSSLRADRRRGQRRLRQPAPRRMAEPRRAPR